MRRGGNVRNYNAYSSLPYNPSLIKRAKELRKAGNLSEVLMWKAFHKGNFRQFDFDRQKVIGNYIVDFFCSTCKVVIEIDGITHDDKIEYDKKCDVYLEGLGLTVIHITASDVLNRFEAVMDMLNDHPALRAPLPRGE